MDVSSSVPLSVPLVPSAFTARSKITGPRTPLTGLRWSCAIVAGERRPSKVPVTARLVPVSTAEAVPDPAIVACIDTSMVTGASRVLNAFGCWAMRKADEQSTNSHVVCRMEAAPPLGRGNHNATRAQSAFRRAQAGQLRLRGVQLVETSRGIELVGG